MMKAHSPVAALDFVVHVRRVICSCLFFFFSSRRRHTRSTRDWSSDVCSSDLVTLENGEEVTTNIAAAMNPASLAVMQGAVGTIGHLYVSKEVITAPNGEKIHQRRMHLRDHPLYAVGTRVRGLPAIMANPTLAAIMDIRAKTGELPPEEFNLTATAIDEDEDATTSD